MRVLITAPSLNEQDNVSGISTMISNIVEHGGREFVHFKAGRTDIEGFDINWLVSQIKLPFSFRRAIADAKADLVHINTSFEPRAMIRDLVLARSVSKRPVVLHVHGGRYVMQDFPNQVLRSIATALLRSAAHVIALGNAEAENLRRIDPNAQITVLPNAVPTKSFGEPERVWGEKNILYLGRFHEAKGLDDIVEACRALRGQGFAFKFTCYGAGAAREKFCKTMSEVMGDRFRYGGIVAGAEKIKALNTGDIFLMPSKFEGLPLALLESMAAGCVPVVSDRGSISSVVDDGRNGFLVEPGDLTQIVGKLKFLLSEGQTGWDDYRRHARATVRENFDIGSYLEKLRSVYTKTFTNR